MSRQGETAAAGRASPAAHPEKPGAPASWRSVGVVWMRMRYRQIDDDRGRRERARTSPSWRSVIVFLIVPILLACSSLAARLSGQTTGPAPEAVVLDIDGAIGPATTLYLRQGFAAAIRRNA